MNSQATSVTSVEPYQLAISTYFAFSRENCHPSIFDFCNNIGTKRTSGHPNRTRVCPLLADTVEKGLALIGEQ